MNYIKLLNSFYDRLETNLLSTSAIALWHALVHVNNKAGWPEEFTVAVSVLCVKTGLSERTINNARNDLKIGGYIDFRSRKGNKSAVYVVRDLSAMVAGNFSDNRTLSAIDADKPSGNASDNLSDSSSDNASALLKLNEIKQNETKEPQQKRSMADILRDPEFAKITQFYGENIAMMNQAISDELNAMCDFLNAELVLLALKESVLANASNNIKYTHAILKSWKIQNFKTVADVEQQEKRKEQLGQQKSNTRRFGGSAREETLPEWYQVHKQESSNQDERKETASESEIDAKRRELQAKLENMRRQNA